MKIGQLGDAAEVQSAFKKRFDVNGRKCKRSFLSETLEAFGEGVGAQGVLADFRGQRGRPGFSRRTGGDGGGLLLDLGHGTTNLVGGGGHEFAESGELLGLQKMALQTVDAGIGGGEVLQRAEKIGTEDVLLVGQQQGKKKDGGQGEMEAESEKPAGGRLGSDEP